MNYRKEKNKKKEVVVEKSREKVKERETKKKEKEEGKMRRRWTYPSVNSYLTQPYPNNPHNTPCRNDKSKKSIYKRERQIKRKRGKGHVRKRDIETERE